MLWIDRTRTTWQYYESKWTMVKTLLPIKKFKSDRNLKGAALTYWLDPEQASLETLQTVYGYTWLTEEDWNKAVVKMAQYDTSKARRLWEKVQWL